VLDLIRNSFLFHIDACGATVIWDHSHIPMSAKVGWIYFSNDFKRLCCIITMNSRLNKKKRVKKHHF